MDYKELIIRGISYSQTQSGAYALLLEHVPSKIKLPVVIGNFEAQAISLGLEKDIQPPRPLTHDLFTTFVSTVNYEMVSVLIYQIVDGVFFSNMIFREFGTGKEIVIDARTSDAVAIAVRFSAPIYTTSQVLEEAGILLEIQRDEPSEPEYKTPSNELGSQDIYNIPLAELRLLLEQAVKDEDFDTALELQEEIKRRKRNLD